MMKRTSGASKWSLPCAIALLASCGPSLPPSEHALLGQAPAPARGWRVEADRVGEWIPIPAPGKVTVVDFWSTTCEPCMKAMPELERLWRASDPAAVQVVGVAVDEEPGDVRQVLPSLGVTFPMVIDSAGVLMGIYKVGGSVPATYVLDRQGRLRFFSGGEDGGVDRVAQAVRALAAE
jgi:thiol-disulfide isomerase/thioredoxin